MLTKTEAEMKRIVRDQHECNVADYIDADFEDADFEEILEIAVDIVVDECDAEQESDGSFDDYAYCAQRATEIWIEKQEDEYLGLGDWLRDLAGDR
jgi:hypothetical protein